MSIFFCVQTWKNTCVSLYLWAYSLCNSPFKGIIKIARAAVWKWKKNNIYEECKVNNWQVQSTLLYSFVCVLFCVGATAISLAHILRLLTSFASYWFSPFIDKRYHQERVVWKRQYLWIGKYLTWVRFLGGQLGRYPHLHNWYSVRFLNWNALHLRNLSSNITKFFV